MRLPKLESLFRHKNKSLEPSSGSSLRVVVNFDTTPGAAAERPSSPVGTIYDSESSCELGVSPGAVAAIGSDSRAIHHDGENAHQENTFLHLGSTARTDFTSFDDFLVGGCNLDDFDWNIDHARSLGPLNIRNWNQDPNAELESKVILRRTNLWHIVLAQELLPVDGSHKTPFLIPRDPGIPLPHHTLCSQFTSTYPHTPLQRTHVSPFAIPSELADTLPSSAPEMLAYLNNIFGTSVAFTPNLERHFYSCVPPDWDVGTAYGHLRPRWAGFASGEYTFWEMDALMGDRRVEDMDMRHYALESTRNKLRDPIHYLQAPQSGDRIVDTEIPPRRVWDLYSNRVVPMSILPSTSPGTVPENVWGVSHSWVDVTERHDVLTSENGKQWPVPLPKGVNLEQIRIELLNMGAEYVFLDVLCLRQPNDPLTETVRQEEWELDVPVLGYVYRHDRYQTTVVYFNGLDDHSTFETCLNWLPGGLTAARCSEWDGRYFMERLHESQRDLGLRDVFAGVSTAEPLFRDLLRAMRRRPGYADKKPYDRVAALAYLLPRHKPEKYLEHEGNEDLDAEDAWASLVQTLSSDERLDLLLHEPSPQAESKTFESLLPAKLAGEYTQGDLGPMPHDPEPYLFTSSRWSRKFRLGAPKLQLASREQPDIPSRARDKSAQTSAQRWWRPTWEEVMQSAASTESSQRNYARSDVLHKYTVGGWRSTRGSVCMPLWYWHSPYVIRGCTLQLSKGTISIQRPVGRDEPEPPETNVHIDFDRKLTSLDCADDLISSPFALVGVAALEYWVVVKEVGDVDFDSGVIALEVRKLAVLRLSNVQERNKIREMDLGQRLNIAYREQNLLLLRTMPLAAGRY
ncbi:hypothetical protein PHLGIDRAFT_127798 [Phlebiopsis gigantea 11061_1 CR5-6]|uniref:Heterokaryon incompatibility domain-containing protein n=1 Tax=Phlebiopsis gigantea (strain 11061_1 CR5-6) TaxID=745531 RepID=A0A0C3S851_PHLG1|nr:hypothetical protein PHLGIDRAFT_127798 [Phlebiopsis gigantea 11061_1 CR5-6]